MFGDASSAATSVGGDAMSAVIKVTGSIRHQNMSVLQKANSMFREKEYSQALEKYKQFQSECPSLERLVSANVTLCKRYLEKDLISKNDGAIKDIDLINEVKASNEFDFIWYKNAYNFHEMNIYQCIQHYLYNFKKGFNPTASFHTHYYLRRYKTVDSSGINPLVHYIRYGKEKDMKP